MELKGLIMRIKFKHINKTNKKFYIKCFYGLIDYLDVLDILKDKKQLSLYSSSINLDMLIKILSNIDNVIKDMNKGYVLEKCSYMCSKCDFYPYCKEGKIFEKG